MSKEWLWKSGICLTSKRDQFIEREKKMQYSSDEISVDSNHQKHDSRGLKYLPHWPAVNIEFQDLVYTVPDISGK